MLTPLPVANSVLAALPRVDYLRLAPRLVAVDLVQGELLCEAGAPLEHVYFPSDCLLSLLTLVDGSAVFAVAVVGHEGISNVATALGAQLSPFRTLVLGSGGALRMLAPDFATEFRANAALREVVLAYVLSLTLQIAQTEACKSYHDLQARLARWLLMTRDRLSRDQFHMTHAMLGQLLGVRREGATHAAQGLKQRGLIDYSRGAIEITDAAGLQAAACSCYHLLETRHGAPRPPPHVP